MSESWLSIFSLCKPSNLIVGVSDLSAIILYTEVQEYFRSKRRFKVENGLLKEADFQQTVIHNWEATKGRHVMYRLDNCSSRMDTWGWNFVRQFRNQISECQRQLLLVHGDASVAAAQEARNLRVQLSKLLLQEEQYWKQRAKFFWLAEGDSNTRFFHSMANTKKLVNKIYRLMDDNARLQEVAKNYFTKLFTQHLLV